MKGFVLIHRAIDDCNFFSTDEPYCERMAWVDLIKLANYEENEIAIRGIKVKLLRGQLGWSEVRLGNKWNWSRTKVRNFLDRLEAAGMISVEVRYSGIPKEVQQKTLVPVQQTVQQNDTAKNAPLTTVISIINYDEYQTKSTAKRTAKRTAKTPDPKTQRMNIDPNQINIAPTFAALWAAYKIRSAKKGSKLVAEKSWDKLSDEEKEKAVRSLDVFLPEWNNGGKCYAPHVSTFLNQKRWQALEDEEAPEPNGIRICPACEGRGCLICQMKGTIHGDTV